jgi:hypothetical protein
LDILSARGIDTRRRFLYLVTAAPAQLPQHNQEGRRGRATSIPLDQDPKNITDTHVQKPDLNGLKLIFNVYLKTRYKRAHNVRCREAIKEARTVHYAVTGQLRPPKYVGLRNSAGRNTSRSEAPRAENTSRSEAPPAVVHVIPKKK